MSDRANLFAPASPVDCLFLQPDVRAVQYKLEPERLTRIGNSNVLRLPRDVRNRHEIKSHFLRCLFQPNPFYS